MANYKHYVVTTREVKKSDNPTDIFFYKSESNNPENAQRFMRAGRYLYSKSLRPDQSINTINPLFYNHLENGYDEDDDFEYKGSTNTIIAPAAIEPRAGTLELFTDIFNELEKTGKALLIFMYGFANKIKKEREHVELLDHAYVQPNTAIGSLLVVSWPSQGKFDFDEWAINKWKLAKYEYKNEEADTEITGYNLAVLFLKLASFIERRKQQGLFVPPIHFMPQSMGHRIVENMMKTFAAQPEAVFKKVHMLFEKLILMSPDMADYALDPSKTKYSYKNVHLLAKKTFVVFSIDDPILPFAKKFNGNEYNIMGVSGPIHKPDHITALSFPQFGNAVIFDQVKTARHRYFEFHKKAIFVFNQLFAGYDQGYPDGFVITLNWSEQNWLPEMENYDYINNRPAEA